MSIKHIKRENGLYTKVECVGCIYDDFEVWVKADKDYCQMCKSPGSEKVPKTINQYT